MREIKIAVCLFGQVRTGQYCAPAIKAAYDQVDGKEIVINFNRQFSYKCIIKVDYFCHTKDYDSVGQAKGAEFGQESPVSDEEINAIFAVYNPNRSGITRRIDEVVFENPEIDSAIKWLLPKPMLLSIIAAINLKKEYELECGWKYDLCVCQRFDALTTPFSPLEKLLQEFGIRDNVIYSHWITSFPQEDGAWGLGDFWFGGDSFAMDLMSASLSQWIIESKRSDSEINESQLGLGPNVMMYNACKKNNIFVIEFPNGLEAAPVRPGADLKLDSMAKHTAHIHHNFFVRNHPSNK
jgi:hypothetical protein